MKQAKAFERHNPEVFKKWMDDVKSKKNGAKVNTSVLMPHNCVCMAKRDENEMANMLFDNLPDYIQNTDSRVMPLADTSSSMNSLTGCGQITNMDVCKGLTLYCSDRLGKDNPFYRRFIQFSEESKFTCWSDLKFSQALEEFNGACTSTNVGSALKLLLDTATMFKVPDNMMPNMLLIISDMQFNECFSNTCYTIVNRAKTPDMTLMEEYLEHWKKSGYTVPKIVYWNLAGYHGQPLPVQKNMIFVSGYSPSRMRAVLTGKSEIEVILKDLETYEVNTP
jgi:hypothetical protein